MAIKVFNRIEKKYLITKSDKRKVLKVIKEHMQHDDYYKSEVFNLYFDNDNFDLITQSIDWTDFKHKIRARSYGGYDRVFIEIKTKIRDFENNLGYKRRVMITNKDFEEFINGGVSIEELASLAIETSNDLQIAKEIDYLMNINDLKPKIMVIYDRESYKNEDSLRITFDENLRYRTNDLMFNSKKDGKMFFKNTPNIIMEVKAQGVLPLWLVNVLSERHIYPQRFSKIGNIYQLIKKGQYV